MLFSFDNCSQWIPMRWPDEWRNSSLLDLLQGTPINCLLVNWGAQKPEAGWMDEARRRNIAVVGMVESGEGKGTALEAARKASLPAVALDDPAGVNMPAIAWGDKGKLPWGSAAGAFAFTDAVWPGIPPAKSGKDSAETGPTGAPWVDSNGWAIQLVRARSDGKPVWVSVAPPKADFIRTSHYNLAVVDACAYGAKWVLTLDPNLRTGLAARKSAALALWKTLTGTLSFFPSHSEWAALPPLARIGVLSTFSGDDEFLSSELLNLLPRRGVPYRILERGKAATASFEGLKGLIYPDETIPDPELKARLETFVNEGGVLVAGPKWPAPAGASPQNDAYGRWDIYRMGKGRVAVSKDTPPDPFLFAADAQLLVSRRHDIFRFFNTSSANAFCTGTPDQKRAVIQIVNYAMQNRGGPVSVAVLQRFKTGRLWRVGREAPEDIRPIPAETGVELHLPECGLYAAIELEA